MRVHRHGQGGMVGRVPLWAARWLGLALIVVTATPSVSRATLKCIGDPVFVSDFQAAIEGIRKTTQIGSDIIGTNENPQGKDHIIERPSGVNKNIAINGAGAHDPL